MSRKTTAKPRPGSRPDDVHVLWTSLAGALAGLAVGLVHVAIHHGSSAVRLAALILSAVLYAAGVLAYQTVPAVLVRRLVVGALAVLTIALVVL